MTDSNKNATSDFSDRHIRVNSVVGEVVVRDDREPLEEVEATAERLLDRAEDLFEKHTDESDPEGMCQ